MPQGDLRPEVVLTPALRLVYSISGPRVEQVFLRASVKYGKVASSRITGPHFF